MAIRIHNLPEKNLNGGSPPLLVPNFNVNYPSWWVSNEHQVPLSLSSNVSSKAESPLQKGNREIKNLSFKIVDQDSSSTQSVSISQSGGANSRDQSISSESGECLDLFCGKHGSWFTLRVDMVIPNFES